MGIRTPWQDRYGMFIRPAASLSAYLGSAAGGIDNASSLAFAAVATDIGFGGDNIFGLPLTDHPDLAANPEFLSNRKRTGLPMQRVGTGMERTRTIKRPTITLNLGEVGAHVIAPFAWLLFQKASSEATTPFAKTFDINLSSPAYDPEAEVYASICRAMSGSDGTDWMAQHGGIARTLNFSMEEGGALSMSAEMILAEIDVPFDPPGTDTLDRLVLPAEAPLLFQDATILLGGTEIDIRTINWSPTNNAILRFYNNAVGQKFILGEFGLTGSFMLPWGQATVGDDEQIKNFIAGTDTTLRIYWGDGTTSSEGEMEFVFNIRYTGAALEPGDEIETNLPFEGTFDAALAAGNTPCKLIVCDGYQFGIT